MGGIEVLERMKALELPTEVVVLTANATVAAAVEAMKLGAYEYLTKPFDLETLVTIVHRANEKRSLRSENLRLRMHMMRQTADRTVIAESPVMRGLLETVGKVARTDLTVLVTGESGAGKEVLARTLHQGSPLADGPFISINCGAIPETMIESELFGYENGAFTGAHAQKLGLLELADNGTLFLDEIGDMPLPLQVKLLRVLETERFFRLGGTREQQIRIRIIAATNKDLKAAVRQGGFREDLFYRISGFVLNVPPLRERKEDIPLFIRHFTGCAPVKRKEFTREALAALTAYAWPGNIRELQHVVQRVLLLSQGETIALADLPLDLKAPRRSAARLLAAVEKEHILAVLHETGGHREKTAEILGIHRKTLRRKLAEYGETE
jgi:DNA-binding NtrC family response regulator